MTKNDPTFLIELKLFFLNALYQQMWNTTGVHWGMLNRTSTGFQQSGISFLQAFGMKNNTTTCGRVAWDANSCSYWRSVTFGGSLAKSHMPIVKDPTISDQTWNFELLQLTIELVHGFFHNNWRSYLKNISTTILPTHLGIAEVLDTIVWIFCSLSTRCSNYNWNSIH